MEITKESAGEWTVVRLRGRLDAFWSDHVARALDELVRQGEHRIQLDFAGVDFLSSAGIRVLLVYYKQLQGLKGNLSVINISESVRKVLELSGLKMFLTSAPVAPAGEVKPRAGTRREKTHAVFEVFEPSQPPMLTCRVIGNAEPLSRCNYVANDCRSAQFPDLTFALGLGALGEGFNDCQSRFGEFLAVAGAIAYQPTDGTNVPDFLLTSGSSVPDVQVCHGLACQGPLGWHARFESRETPAPLLDIIDACFEFCSAPAMGFVMAAETAGLIGAALRKSPVGGGHLFRHPEICDWLSFAAERVYARSLAVVVGVASTQFNAVLAPLVRPLTNSPFPFGHFHAAALTYHPLAKGGLNLQTTLRQLFESQTLQGILHLLNDYRPIIGGGQSEFVRGACWWAPIDAIARS